MDKYPIHTIRKEAGPQPKLVALFIMHLERMVEDGEHLRESFRRVVWVAYRRARRSVKWLS
jgi:hypothetical protein